MPRLRFHIVTIALALALGSGLTAGATGARAGIGPGGRMPGMRRTDVRIDHNLQRRLWGLCQALRAELNKAHPDENRVRRLSGSIHRLWAKLTRQWFAERPGDGRSRVRGPNPGFAPGPGVRMDQALGAGQ